MRKTMLAVFAGFGVLAAGCTNTDKAAPPSGVATATASDDAAEARANAAEAAGCREIAPDGSCIPTLNTMRVGSTVWADELSFVNLDDSRVPCGLIDPTTAYIDSFQPSDLDPANLDHRPMVHWLVKRPDKNTLTFRYLYRTIDLRTAPTYRAVWVARQHGFYTGRNCPK